MVASFVLHILREDDDLGLALFTRTPMERQHSTVAAVACLGNRHWLENLNTLM